LWQAALTWTLFATCFAVNEKRSLCLRLDACGHHPKTFWGGKGGVRLDFRSAAS
jgi:hypothetical protein